jgi:hypothetical protein
MKGRSADRVKIVAGRWRLAGFVALALAVGGCASVGSRTGDPGLAITCDVVDAAGRPVEGAEVLLRLQAGVRGTPLREERKVTPADGAVLFSYTTEQRSTPYALTVSKAGYETTTVAGVAAAGPEGNRRSVMLLRAPR